MQHRGLAVRHHLASGAWRVLGCWGGPIRTISGRGIRDENSESKHEGKGGIFCGTSFCSSFWIFGAVFAEVRE